jgi:hypothetical protein
MNLDFRRMVMCCLTTSLRGAFIIDPEVDPDWAHIRPPRYVYRSWVEEDVTPFCLNHSFATVLPLGEVRRSLNGLNSDCLGSREFGFQVIFGACAPMPPSVLAARNLVCDLDEYYGDCTPCAQEELWQPPEGPCVHPVVNDQGDFDWPDVPQASFSMDAYHSYLDVMGEILRKRYLKIACQCLENCPELNCKGQVKLVIESSGTWCDGNFKGVQLTIAGTIG